MYGWDRIFDTPFPVRLLYLPSDCVLSYQVGCRLFRAVTPLAGDTRRPFGREIARI